MPLTKYVMLSIETASEMKGVHIRVFQIPLQFFVQSQSFSIYVHGGANEHAQIFVDFWN